MIRNRGTLASISEANTYSSPPSLLPPCSSCDDMFPWVCWLSKYLYKYHRHFEQSSFPAQIFVQLDTSFHRYTIDRPSSMTLSFSKYNFDREFLFSFNNLHILQSQASKCFQSICRLSTIFIMFRKNHRKTQSYI